MASNSFGDFFKFTTWGESHGSAIGCVIDGVPSGLEISKEYIQRFLDKRKPGGSIFVSSRVEDDKVEILSGIYNGYTTGAPISAVIWNKDQKPEDYKNHEGNYRSGHGDYVYEKKYGIRDHRGGGRASARETACRVIAGAIARKIIGEKIIFESSVVQIGVLEAEQEDINFLKTNDFYCPDPGILEKWKSLVLDFSKRGDSLGGKAKIVIKGIKSGLGEPIYKKLSSKLGEAILSINSVKGVEFGAGFDSVGIYGSKYHDKGVGDHLDFDNNSGGIDAGISNGQDIVIKFVTKPPSSIANNLYDQKNNLVTTTKGRHDPTTIIRAIPVAEAMCSCVIADLLLQNCDKKAPFLA